MALRPKFEQTWKKSARLCYIPNMNALDNVVLDKKIFQCFPYIRLCKDPGTGP